MDSSVYVGKTNALVSCAVAAQVMYGFFFWHMHKESFLMTQLIFSWLCKNF